MTVRSTALRKQVSRSAVAVTLTTLVLAAAGCSSSGGTTDGAPESPSSETTSPSTSQSAGPILASMDPCKMLTPDEAAQFAVEGPGESHEVAGSRDCRWDAAKGKLAVGFNKDSALDELNFSDGEQQPYDLGVREAKIVRGNTGTICTVAIAVNDSETVTVGGNASDIAASCAMAKKAAPLVEAKLPEK